MKKSYLHLQPIDSVGRGSRAARRHPCLGLQSDGETNDIVMNSRQETETRIRADRHDDVSIILLMCKDLSIDKVVINFFLPYIPTVHGFFFCQILLSSAYHDRISSGHIDHPQKPHPCIDSTSALRILQIATLFTSFTSYKYIPLTK